MRVESPTNAALLGAAPQPLTADQQVQAVFSDVLEAVGRRGYASAPDAPSDAPLASSVPTAWEDWFDSQRTGRYAQVENAKEVRQGFSDIVTRAHHEGGYAEPKEFLQTLSTEELAVVQRVQALAQPIDVDSLSEEGALNLLLPPAAQVDLNHDGLTQSGAGYGLRFPDSNTPPHVAAAWQEATADMSIGERMTYELQMLTPIMTANIHLNPDGTYSHTTEPGDPDYRNPYADGSLTYDQSVQQQLDYLDFVRNWIPEDQYDRGVAFWSKLQDLLAA